MDRNKVAPSLPKRVTQSQNAFPGLDGKKIILLEDGCEQNTVFDHNLGLGTRRGSLTPSDKQPTTFWFVSPLVEVTNNAAAGSETKDGMGIWFLFPDEPVAHCKGLNIFEKKEAKSTPIPRYV